MINNKVELNKSEQAICESIAKQRYENNRKNNVKDAKVGDQGNWETDLEGFGAEMAFCKLHNIFPDFTVSIRNSSQDDGDCVLGDLRVDVKATKYQTGKLLAVPWKNNGVELYGLMIGTFPKYIFKGFMSAKELIKEERLGSLGYGKTYIAEQRELVGLNHIGGPFKFKLKYREQYKWSNDNVCYNTKNGEVIKQVYSNGVLGYVIDDEFKSLDQLRDKLIKI